MEKIILKLIVRYLLREIRDGQGKLWVSREKVLIKVLTKFSIVKIKTALKKQQKVGKMQQNDQKLKIKFHLEAQNYKLKSSSKKKKHYVKKWKQIKG